MSKASFLTEIKDLLFDTYDEDDDLFFEDYVDGCIFTEEHITRNELITLLEEWTGMYSTVRYKVQKDGAHYAAVGYHGPIYYYWMLGKHDDI